VANDSPDGLWPMNRWTAMHDQDEIVKLRASLKRCLEEAESWLFDARGCKPKEVMGYDGWADDARKLLDEMRPEPAAKQETKRPILGLPRGKR
jgi:hypothetical protein